MIARGVSVSISPTKPVMMGCGPSRELIGAVRDPLEANLLLISEGDARVLLVSIDALYVGPVLRAELEVGLADHLDPDQLFMGASHTHYAPMLDTTKPLLGTVDPEHLERVVGLLLEAALHLLSVPGVPVGLSHARFATQAPISRRLPRRLGGVEGRVRFNTVVMGPNRMATGNQFGHALKVDDDSGDPVAVVWQLPCHPTSLPLGFGHSAHFPGEMRARLRRRAGRDIPVLFFQGFSGDLRPPSVARPVGFKSRARLAVLGPWFTSFDEAAYESWIRSMWEELESGLQSAVSVDCDPSDPCLSMERRTWPICDFVSGPAAVEREAAGHKVALGALDLIGFSAELVSAYAKPLEANSKLRPTIPIGCLDDVFGYAPTREMIEEGGYEASGFLAHFGLTSTHQDFEGRVTRCLASVVG